MNRNSLTTAVVAGIAGVVGIANMANAVNLNPDGLGQVLLYPYYTTNAHQQTLISVVNTTSVGKAVKVRFLEGHNSREVLDFNLFLSPFDVWTANVFALSDAGAGSSGAGIFTTDNSCTAPALTESKLSNGQGYVAFRNYAYAGANSDSGPTTLDRSQEGHFELISMGDIDTEQAGDPVIPGTNPPVTYSQVLLGAITHVNGVPPDCAHAEKDFEAGNFAAVDPPTSGLFGAASVVNVAQGIFYAYNADAIDGFTNVPLPYQTGQVFPNLSQVNDVGGTTATSYVFNNGKLLTSTWSTNQRIDAVSSIFAAANVYNEWQSAADGSVGSDWVVTFPTKRFYVDPGLLGTTGSFGFPAPAIQPFTELFGGLTCSAQSVQVIGGVSHNVCTNYAYADPDNSCVGIGASLFNREEGSFSPSGCTFSPCPPGQRGSAICKETNIISFLADGTQPDILGSKLRLNLNPFGSAGWANLAFSGAKPFRPATGPAGTGNVFHGLPVTGFEAVDFVNGNLNGVLANYSGVYRHRISRNCTNANGAGGACS